MEEIKRIYSLLLHSDGLKIRVIAEKLELDTLHVAEIMFSSQCIPYWYQNEESLWFAKEEALEIEEVKEDKLISRLELPKNFKIDKYLDTVKSEAALAYLNYISKYRTYTYKETIELFKRYRNGDLKAYDAIVKGNLRLVAHIALYYSNRGVSYEDLIQEGNIGLLKAIERFDYNIALSFNNLAKSWILQSILLALSDLPYLVGLPLNQLNLYDKIKKYKRKFEQENGYEPSASQIKIDEDISEDRISYLSQLPDDLLDVCVTDELDIYESDLYPTDEYENIQYTSYSIDYLLSWRLTDREKDVIRMYYGIGCREMTLEEIGSKFGLTRERMRQIGEKAIRKLRKPIHGNKYFVDIDLPHYPIIAPPDSIRDEYRKSRTVTKKKEKANDSKNKPSTLDYSKRIYNTGTMSSTTSLAMPERPNISNTDNPDRHNDYGVLASRIQEGNTTKTSINTPKSDTTNISTRKNKRQRVVYYQGITVGERLIYNTSQYVISCRVLEIDDVRNRLMVEYENGVVDNIPLDHEKIQHFSTPFKKTENKPKSQTKDEKPTEISDVKKSIWYEKSIGIKWIIIKIAENYPRAQIVQQFNRYHRLGLTEFSSQTGSLIDSAILSTWIRELSELFPEDWFKEGTGKYIYRGKKIKTYQEEVDFYFKHHIQK